MTTETAKPYRVDGQNWLPLLTDEQLASTNTGYRLMDDRYHGLLPLVRIAPSASNPGCWHVTVHNRVNRYLTGGRRPIRAVAVNWYLRYMCKDDLRDVTTSASWQPFDQTPVNIDLGFSDPSKEQTPEDPVDVYLIGDKYGGGLVKIGVSEFPHSRLAQIQLMSPVTLSIFATIPAGGYEMENLLHKRYASDRVHGEWFRPSPELFAEFGLSR